MEWCEIEYSDRIVGKNEREGGYIFPSGTPFNFTTFFTTFAGDNMPRYATICQHMPFYPYLVSAIPVD